MGYGMISTRKRDNGSHRGRLDIIADILDASHGGVKKTYLMYRCNLSFKQLKYYLGFMVETDFLRLTADDSGGSARLLEVTEKGKEFMKIYESITDLMK